MQERIRLVFRESQLALVDCYRPALERDPMIYGEIVVGVSITPAGEVADTQVVFSTITDTDMVECVLSETGGFAFPSHSREAIRASYPFLFTNDATPPEVVRALKVRHGLIPPDPVLDEDIDAEPARGQEGWAKADPPGARADAPPLGGARRVFLLLGVILPLFVVLLGWLAPR